MLIQNPIRKPGMKLFLIQINATGTFLKRQQATLPKNALQGPKKKCKRFEFVGCA